MFVYIIFGRAQEKLHEAIGQINQNEGNFRWLLNTNYFAKKGIRAECIKLNGAVELAPKLKICSTIVDLVSTGKTLSENNLEESNLIMQITSKLIINKIAYKLMNDDITKILNKFKRS